MKFSDILLEKMLEKSTPPDQLMKSGVINIDDHKFTYEAKVYRFKSTIGLDNGRIVKLKVIDEKNKILIEYDHYWIIKPAFTLSKEVLERILNEFNS
jgi:hypothetical protein